MRRVLYMGQKPIGESCFELLIKNQNSNYQIEGIVSNQSNSNVWWHSNKIYQYSMENKIEFIDNVSRNEDTIMELMEKRCINCIISVGHNWILSDRILKYVNYEAVNLHLAKLPDYKGNYTYNHAILNEEKEYGVTLHWMDGKVDEGDCIFTALFQISEDDTAYSLYKKSNAAGTELFKRYVDCLKENELIPRRKMEGEGNFYSKSSINGLREIKKNTDKKEIQIKSRAFYFPPFENAYFVIDGEKYYVIPNNKKGGLSDE